MVKYLRQEQENISAIQAIVMLIGMSMASGLGDHIGIVPMLLIDAGFNILAALLAFVLIRVSYSASRRDQRHHQHATSAGRGVPLEG